MKEIAGKMIVCNLHRFLLFLIGKVFTEQKNVQFFYSDLLKIDPSMIYTNQIVLIPDK